MNKQLERIKNIIPYDRVGLIIAALVIVAVFTYLNPMYLTQQNLTSMLVAASLVGLVAIGETLLIIAGCSDLSPGAVAAFASVLAAVLLDKGAGTFMTFVVVAIAGVIIGLINAFAVNKMKLEPFIATLATMSLFRGLAYIMCGGQPMYVKEQSFLNIGTQRIFGIPIPVVVLILCFIVFGVLLSKTAFGRNLYVVGGSKTAARLAGISPNKIITLLYVFMGVLSSIGGAILTARMSSGQPSACNGLEFDAITAAVLGGTAFSGGIGTIFGTVLGVLILQGFNTGLLMLNVPVFWQYVARGLLLLIALGFDMIRRNQREKKHLKQSMMDINMNANI